MSDSQSQTSILVPLDGSALAEGVLPHALALARITGSGLVLLRVTHTTYWPWAAFGIPTVPYIDPHLYDELWEAELEGARSYLADVAQRLESPDVPDVPIGWEVLQGDPAQAIVSYLEQRPHLRLAAMATHGRSGLRGWMLGSVVERVLHASTKPLLVVRPTMPATGSQAQTQAAPTYRTIVVPLDGSQFAEQALAHARELAALTGAELALVTVKLGSEDYKHQAHAGETWAIADRREMDLILAYLDSTAERLRASGLAVSTHVAHGYPPEEILKAGEETQAGMIVMATHGHSGLQRLRLGSIALKVVQASNLPVLLIRPVESSEQSVANSEQQERRPE